MAEQRPSATIIAWPGTVPANTLTAQDRIEALRFPALDGARVRIHAPDAGRADGVGDFVSIYPADEHWAAFGAARKGRMVEVWRSANGQDLGRFRTMHEALTAITRQPLRRRRVR